MKRFFLLFVLGSSLVLAGCGGAPSGPTNVEPTANSSPTEYSDAATALSEGIRMLDIGETDQAIDALNQAVKLDPDLADAYFQLGIAYALVETRDAGEIPGEVPSEPGSDGNSRHRLRSNSEIAFEKAAARYKKMIEANNDDPAVYFNLGRAYNKLNQDESAEDAFAKAVKLSPENTEYQTKYGAILIKLAKYREAIAPLKKALELDPENVEAMELLEDAEAGRRRVSYSGTPKKDDGKSSNSNTSNSNVAVPPPANTTKTPDRPQPVPSKPPSSRPGLA